MLIDWFTVVAQIVNFLILVYLLKRFLYKPILKAIDAREKRIASEIENAEKKRAEARKERDAFQQKNKELEEHRDELMSRAEDEAKSERRRLIEEAQNAADVMRGKRREALKREHESLKDEIRRRIREEVFAVSRKALSDLAGASLEERMGEVFGKRLRELDEETKKKLSEALAASSEPVLVRSAFDLPDEQREAIQAAVKEAISAEIPVKFETAPDLVGGIELVAKGHKVAWSIADYLSSLEKDVEARLQPQTPNP
ncbi:MAG: F0F1 ATP synthase subunit delta [Acidobacteriota bacterium]|nr:F0F1 ATP synthase subunit delta [Acidobacteriota bacterium]